VPTESGDTFPTIRNGYHPFAVDAYIGKLETKQKSLLDKVETLKARLDESTMETTSLRDEAEEVETLKARLDESTKQAASLRDEAEEVETLKARLDESTKEVASLRDEIADLNDNSSPHAMADRMSKILQAAVDEATEMHAEAEAKAEALIATTVAEAETARRKQEEMLADIAAQQSALDAECEQTKKELDVELAAMRAEAESAADEARQDAQRQREKLLLDAKNEAHRYLDQVQRAVGEQVTSLSHALEAIPTALDKAHQENGDRRNSVIPFPFEQEVVDGPDLSKPSQGTSSELARSKRASKRVV
jgi:chromosome segregation ATPase